MDGHPGAPTPAKVMCDGWVLHVMLHQIMAHQRSCPTKMFRFHSVRTCICLCVCVHVRVRASEQSVITHGGQGGGTVSSVQVHR